MIRRFLGGTGWVALVVGLVAGVGCSDGEGLKKAVSGILELNPSEFVFAKLPAGSSEDRAVELKNVADDGEVIITKISARFRSSTSAEFTLFWQDASGDDFVGIESDGTDKFTYPLRIDAGELLKLVLNYSPEDDTVDDGTITIETNLEGQREVEIPIVIAEGGADIDVSPQDIDFGRVPALTEKTEIVTVTNVGSTVLLIGKVLLNGSQDFVPIINGKDPRRQPEVLEDPDEDGQPGLAANAQFEISVRYAPPSEGPDSAELSIFSNDPNQPESRVQLRANGAISCLRVNPTALEFRTSLVGRTDSRPLSIESCGTEPLEITSIALSPDTDPAFALDFDSLPSLPALLPAVTPDSPPASRSINIEFTPRDQRIYNGKLIIESNDPVHPRMVVSLLGRGVDNACPQARVTQEEFYVLPLDTVTLDGSPSIDQDGPNGQPRFYEWVVVDRPEGSLSDVVETFFMPASPDLGGQPDDLDSPTANFWVDLAGTYVFELRVIDNLGLSSVDCDTSTRVYVVAQPDQDIHVQLVWRTPDDPDQTDRRGADLDLHLLHPFAENWFTAPYDLFYQNPEADWGILGETDDDPVLDIDDTDGGGPENINLNKPESTELAGATYKVGVHYYLAEDRQDGEPYGSSFAKVRIFLRGELAYDGVDDENETGEREMLATDHFWYVAEIQWPAMIVTKADQYFTQRP